MTSFEPRPGMYELRMRSRNGDEEVRLTDSIDRFSSGDGTLVIRGERWDVLAEEPARTPRAVARLVCRLSDRAATSIEGSPPD
jgi:hypothetical protein